MMTNKQFHAKIVKVLRAQATDAVVTFLDASVRKVTYPTGLVGRWAHVEVSGTGYRTRTMMANCDDTGFSIR